LFLITTLKYIQGLQLFQPFFNFYIGQTFITATVAVEIFNKRTAIWRSLFNLLT